MRVSVPVVAIAALWCGSLLVDRPAVVPLASTADAQATAARRPSAPPATLHDVSQHLAKVAAEVSPSVVHIQSERSGSAGRLLEETGSGVLVRGPGRSGVYLVTNRHVVAEAELADISVFLHDGRVLNPIDKREDIATDLAVLRMHAAQLLTAEWGDSDELQIGHLVVAMGSPFGLDQSVTLGIISAKGRRSLQLGSGREVINQDFLQTDAAINPGNSGGPLIDMHGRIAGINTAIASQGGGNEGIGFSIPSNLVRRVVDQLVRYGKVQRAYLGVKLDETFDYRAAQKLNLDRTRGALVMQVYPGTPADEAHLRKGDLILQFDGLDIEDENHLIHLVSLSQVNYRVRLTVLRSGRQITVDVSLAERPLSQQAQDDGRDRRLLLRPGQGEALH